MIKNRWGPVEQPAFSLLEEAFYLLRMQMTSTLIWYYLGSVPFALSLLYFVADMSQSPMAAQRCMAFSLLLAVLFIWMKFCHSVFAEKTRERLFNHKSREFHPARLIKVAACQAFIAAIGIPLLILSLILTVPLGWMIAFFQNANVCPFSSQNGVREILGIAKRQSLLAPRQNHWMLFFLSSFGIVVMINVGFAMFAVPYLAKILFGIETSISLNYLSLLNTTYLMTTGMITWMLMDPILKTVYVLRCFYGNSISSGDDILASIELLKSRRTVRLALVLSGLLLLPASLRPLHAAETQASAEGSSSQAQLELKISEVAKRREYQWRTPRDSTLVKETDHKNWLDGFLDELEKAVKAVLDWIESVIRKIASYFKGSNPPPNVNLPHGGSGALMKGLLAVISALLVGLIIYFLCKFRSSRTPVVSTMPLAPVTPNLEDDSVTADQLPEDSWFTLAEELFAKGDNRKALRALFLGCLANLSSRQLVMLARYKSNHDYQREVTRRGKASGELPDKFASMVKVYDCVWYGKYQMTGELLLEAKAIARSIAQK